MTDTDSKALKVKEKQEVATPAEPTKPGAVFMPEVDIFETETAITMLVDMPGVKTENLTIDLRENVLTLEGGADVVNPPGEKNILIEYEIGKYLRQFTLAESIDQNRIDAKLSDGVLRLTLPKVEKAAPRKISIKAG